MKQKEVDVEKLAMDNKALKAKWSHLYQFGYPKKPYPTNYLNDLNMVMLGYYQAQALQSNAKMFSLEDMKRAIAWGRGFEIGKVNPDSIDYETKQFIQSLTKEQETKK
jgi:hypothetical protein